MLRVGVLGSGAVLQLMIPALRSSMLVYAIASRDAERAENAARKFDIPNYYGSYESLISDANIDVVYVALPNSLHCTWTIEALRAGKHVLVEKPIALTLDELDTVIDAANRAKRVVMEALWYRYHAQYQMIRDLISNGEMGKIVFIQSSLCFRTSNVNDPRWKSDLGGGALNDLICYLVDFLINGCLLDLNKSSRINSIARYVHGVIASLHSEIKMLPDITASLTVSIEQDSDNLTILGTTHGVLKIPNLLMFPSIKKQYFKRFTASGDFIHEFPYENAYANMVAEFAKYIQSGDGKVVSIVESRENIRFMQQLNSKLESWPAQPMVVRKKFARWKEMLRTVVVK